MGEPVRLTERDPESGAARLAAGADAASAVDRLAAFEDLASDVRHMLEDTVSRLEALRAEGKVKTVTYRQLSSNRAALKETLALFEERGL